MQDGARDAADRLGRVRLSAHGEGLLASEVSVDEVASARAATLAVRGRTGSQIWLKSDGHRSMAHVAKVGDTWWVHHRGHVHEWTVQEAGATAPAQAPGDLTAPMPGSVLVVLVEAGQRVSEGQPLIVLEAMKMEHRLTAPGAGTVVAVHHAEGDQVAAGEHLIELDLTEV